MRLPSDAELNSKKAAQASSMDDICHIIHNSYASGTYSNYGTETQVMVSGVACGIQFVAENMRNIQATPQRAGMVILMDYDVILRLAPDEPVLLTDDILLYEKGNIRISGTFQPSNSPTVSSSVQHVPLKRVTT